MSASFIAGIHTSAPGERGMFASRSRTIPLHAASRLACQPVLRLQGRNAVPFTP